MKGKIEARNEAREARRVQIRKCHINQPKKFYIVANEFILVLKV